MKRHLYQLLKQGPKLRRNEFFVAAIVGLAAGLAALGLEHAVSWLGSWRVYLSGQFPPLLVLPLTGLAGGLLSGFLVQKFAPSASGSGIPQVRAYLLGVPVPLDIPVTLVKLLGGSLALGSGHFMGREGPTVHVGAAISAMLTKRLGASPRITKQMVAAGAGAGLAAAFNAPIAGVLFVAEELLKDVSSITIRTALVSCFVASVVTKVFEAPHIVQSKEMISFHPVFAAQDILFWILLGVLCGTLGALFNAGIVAFLNFNRDCLKVPTAIKVALAGTLSGVIVALVPPDRHFGNYAALKDMIAAGSTDAQTSIMAFSVFFLLTLLAYGSGAPGGLFAPSLVLGSALGSLTALLEQEMLGVGSPETMAYIGMGGFFAAVARVPVTAVVIVCEMTGHYHLVLPLMITAATAVFVGSRIQERSVYDLLREWSGLVAPEEAAGGTAHLRARDLMTSAVTRVSLTDRARALEEAIGRQDETPIAVYDGAAFIGLVSRQRIAALGAACLPDTATAADLLEASAFAAPEDTLADLAARLGEADGEALPVVHEGELLGVVRRRDLCRHVAGRRQ